METPRLHDRNARRICPVCNVQRRLCRVVARRDRAASYRGPHVRRHVPGKWAIRLALYVFIDGGRDRGGPPAVGLYRCAVLAARRSAVRRYLSVAVGSCRSHLGRGSCAIGAGAVDGRDEPARDGARCPPIRLPCDPRGQAAQTAIELQVLASRSGVATNTVYAARHQEHCTALQPASLPANELQVYLLSGATPRGGFPQQAPMRALQIAYDMQPITELVPFGGTGCGKLDRGRYAMQYSHVAVMRPVGICRMRCTNCIR